MRRLLRPRGQRPQLHWAKTQRWERSWGDLDATKHKAYYRKLEDFVEDCGNARPGEFPHFRRGLRVHRIEGSVTPVTYSMTWAMEWYDGRATFVIEVGPDYLRVTWLDIGSHEIYRRS